MSIGSGMTDVLPMGRKNNLASLSSKSSQLKSRSKIENSAVVRSVDCSPELSAHVPKFVVLTALWR